MSNKSNQILLELFDLLPFGLKQKKQLGNQTIFTSNKIEKYLIKLLSQESDFNVIKRSVEKGIDKDKIIIGFSDPKKWTFIKKRFKNMMKWDQGTTTLGCFFPELNKILILLDDNVKISGKEIDNLNTIIYHELVHYCAYNKPNFFFKTFSKLFLEFFSTAIKYIAPDLKYKQSDLAICLRKVFERSEIKITKGDMELFEIFDYWHEFFNKTTSNKTDAATYAKILYFSYIHHNINTLDKTETPYMIKGIKAYQEAYKKLGIKNIFNYTMPGQEIVYLSEIISIYYSVNHKLKQLAPIINTIKW